MQEFLNSIYEVQTKKYTLQLMVLATTRKNIIIFFVENLNFKLIKNKN